MFVKLCDKGFISKNKTLVVFIDNGATKKS
jgi:hypothetical protein